MKTYRYVTLDPTGNLTCLVLDDTPAEDRARVTRLLMEKCEQVGYLESAPDDTVWARLCMMGGEFCGNAAMACAAYLAQRAGRKEETIVPLAVSGAKEKVRCLVRPEKDGAWEGTVSMPPVTEISRMKVGEKTVPLVRLEGIAHLILEGETPGNQEAEEMLLRAAAQMPDPCAGLLLWDEKTGFLRPLVYVKESRTMVWETGCGSGSTAVGVWKAMQKGDGITETAVAQPGGVIRVTAEIRGGKPAGARITGKVLIGAEEILTI